jgi:hypothetical protein
MRLRGLLLVESEGLEMLPVHHQQPAGAPVQGLLAFARPLSSRVRSVRRPFNPQRGEGRGYRLPHDVREALGRELAPFRNRDAAFALAEFLARFWTVPGRVGHAFPIDRRALADRADLALTEAQVRGAVRVLEAIGFLDRTIPAPGSRYKPTEEGLHRKPIWFVFGADYAKAFLAANARAKAARGRAGERRKPQPSEPTRSAPQPASFFLNANSPKRSERSGKRVIMGEIAKSSGIPPDPSARTPLDAALERLALAFGLAEGGRPKD